MSSYGVAELWSLSNSQLKSLVQREGLSTEGDRDTLIGRLTGGRSDSYRGNMYSKGDRVRNIYSNKLGTILRSDAHERQHSWSRGVYHYSVEYDDRSFEPYESESDLVKESVDELKPPSYAKSSSLGCEGYWSDGRGEDKKSKSYQPIPSDEVWGGKSVWMDRPKTVEKYISGVSGETYKCFRGMTPCRLCNEMVGNCEYHMGKMCWPEGYVEHYIGHHNVMPTKKFYKFINKTYESISRH